MAVQVIQSVMCKEYMKAMYAMIIFVFLLISCGGEEEQTQADSYQEMHANDSILVQSREWVEYFESSDVGLWEDSLNHLLEYTITGPLVVESEIEPVLFQPFALCSYGDTVFVTDAATRKILALDSNGKILWSIGGQGEGPGLFVHMSTIAVSECYVAALNYALARIDFFNRDGSFSHSLSFQLPQDIVCIDDTTFAVASSQNPGGQIHIVNPATGVLKSFGSAEFDKYADILRMDLMRLCYGGNGRIALFNRYEGLLAIYDIETEERIFGGSRSYPATPTAPISYIGEDGRDHMVFFPIGGNAFLGPEGMLNVIICNYMDDGSFISDPEYLDFAPITCVDRYDWDGNYLDSYCLPDSCINFVTRLPNGDIVGCNFESCVLERLSRL